MSRSYAATTRKLVDAYAELTPELQKAARFMLEYPEEIGLNSMRKVARKAGVKPATVSRLSKALGYKRYEALREPFRERLRKIEPSYARGVEDLQQRAANSGNLVEELREQEIRNIEQTLSPENFAALDDAAVFAVAALEPQNPRCSLPGDKLCPQLKTNMSKSKLRMRSMYCDVSMVRTRT